MWCSDNRCLNTCFTQGAELSGLSFDESVTSSTARSTLTAPGTLEVQPVEQRLFKETKEPKHGYVPMVEMHIKFLKSFFEFCEKFLQLENVTTSLSTCRKFVTRCVLCCISSKLCCSGEFAAGISFFGQMRSD